MSIRPDLLDQLPPRGPARVAVIAALILGALVAIGLTVLIVVFVATATCGLGAPPAR